MTQSYQNVFAALEEDTAVAKNLFIRSRLMLEIRKYIKENKMTQKEASIKMGATQPRISDLMRGKIDLFTIDMLVSMLEKIGIDIEVSLNKAA